METDHEILAEEARDEITAAAIAEGVHLERREGTLERYCATYPLWRIALARLQDDGDQAADNVQTFVKLARLLSAIRSELGLSPSGARRPSVAEQTPGVDVDEQTKSQRETLAPPPPSHEPDRVIYQIRPKENAG